MESVIDEPTTAATFAELVAGCVRVIEQRRVEPLARAIAASDRLAALRDDETSRHGVFACWQDDVAALVEQFAGPPMLEQVARAETDQPGHCLSSLEASCLCLIAAREELLPVHALWLRLSALQDRRPVFGLWQARAVGVLSAHDEASEASEPERARQFNEATDVMKLLVALHPSVVEAHGAWTELVQRRAESDTAHEVFAGWRAVVDGFTDRSGQPDVIRIAAHGGTAASVVDLKGAYRSAIAVLRAQVTEHTALRDKLKRRRVELDGWMVKMVTDLNGMIQYVNGRRGAVTEAAARARSSVRFNSDHYSTSMSVGGTVGAFAGLASCVSNGLAAGHIVIGALLGAVVGPAAVAVSHGFAASSHSAETGRQHQVARVALGEACSQATSTLERAASLRTQAVAALMQPAALDSAAVALRHVVEQAQREA